MCWLRPCLPFYRASKFVFFSPFCLDGGQSHLAKTTRSHTNITAATLIIKTTRNKGPNLKSDGRVELTRVRASGDQLFGDVSVSTDSLIDSLPGPLRRLILS